MNRGFSTRERAVDSRGSVLLRLDSPAQLFEQIDGDHFVILPVSPGSNIRFGPGGAEQCGYSHTNVASGGLEVEHRAQGINYFTFPVADLASGDATTVFDALSELASRIQALEP